MWVSPVSAFAIILPRNVLERVGSQTTCSVPTGSATVFSCICHNSVVRAEFNVLSCWSANGRMTITRTVPSLKTCVNVYCSQSSLRGRTTQNKGTRQLALWLYRHIFGDMGRELFCCSNFETDAAGGIITLLHGRYQVRTSSALPTSRRFSG